MSQFASEKHALGLCARCNFAYPLKTLKYLTVRMKRTKTRVCPECWEADHPQYKLGTFPVYDPQALQNARPDIDRAGSIGRFGWNPVWTPRIRFTIGTIVVS